MRRLCCKLLGRHAGSECQSAARRAIRLQRRDRCRPPRGDLNGVTAATTSEVPSPPALKRREHVPLGILHMVGATIVFAASSACSKWLVATYPVGEVLFTRSSISLITLALIILPTSGLAVFRTGRLRHHVLRSFSQFVSQSCLLIAFSMMPLASATAINFSAPLFATLVSIVHAQGEGRAARWSGAAGGLHSGVLIVANPGAGAFPDPEPLFALANRRPLRHRHGRGARHDGDQIGCQPLTLYQLLLITSFRAPAGPVRLHHAEPGTIGALIVLQRRRATRSGSRGGRNRPCTSARPRRSRRFSTCRWSGPSRSAISSGATCRRPGSWSAPPSWWARACSCCGARHGGRRRSCSGRHGRACPGHPRLRSIEAPKTRSLPSAQRFAQDPSVPC